MVAPIVAAAALGGLASLGGTMLQNSAGAAAADKQMAFQKETLRHQYQWGMEDMKKAGLNPILAYKQGGAGSASGSSYTPQNIGSAAVQGASTAASSAVQANRQETELGNIAADTALKNEQNKTQKAMQVQAASQAGLNAANSARAVAETQRVGTSNALMNLSMNSARAAAAQGATDEEINRSWYGQMLRGMERAVTAISPVIQQAPNSNYGSMSWD